SEALAPVYVQPGFAVYQLPNASWARRVSGVFSNDLVRVYPNRAHAVLTERDDGAFLVSVRAPFNRRTGAEAVCSQFDTGGGREAAAGINRLPAGDLDQLIAALATEYGGQI
ncbi:MAG: DHH family phosphoesterase, partial [Luminiphilus sp.]